MAFDLMSTEEQAAVEESWLNQAADVLDHLEDTLDE